MAIPQVVRASEEDFADPDIDDLDAFETNELQSMIRNKLPIIIPWHNKKTLRLGTSIHSSRLTTEEPWDENNSPFLLAHLYRVPPVLTRDYGTVASFKSTSTSLRRDTKDHLSLGFGVGVGLPFLAEVSVKGQYDKDLQENRDSNKASIRASIRAGSVELSAQPRLTNKAIRTIKYDGGVEALEKEYGDYYVAGYRLGGDTAMLISSSAYSSFEKEVYDVSVTCEVLFYESSDHWSEAYSVFSSGSALKLLGYDTLDAKNWSETSNGRGEGAAKMFEKSREIALTTQCLSERLSDILDGMNLHHGDKLTMQQCDELTKRGLVVELVLMPVRTVRHVIEWMVQDNII